MGKYVDKFEKDFALKVGSKYAITTVNGTAALHISLILADVKKEDEVITQALTFIATCNAISYIGAQPIFVDVDLDTLGLSPKSLKNFLETNCEILNNQCINKTIKKPINKIGNIEVNDNFYDLETSYGYGGFYTNCDDKLFIQNAMYDRVWEKM